MSKKVAVLMGGWSAERPVSLSSGKSCGKALRESGYDVTDIDVTQNVEKLITDLRAKPFDAAFNALHGKGGEDGVIHGLLDMLAIPYTHSGVLASALAMDKQKTREFLSGHDMPVAQGGLVRIGDILQGKVPVAKPYVIKPNTEGSSVGVYIVREGDNKPPLGLEKWTYGDSALVEEYIAGKELSVAVIGNAGEKACAMTVTEIVSHTDFYDYEAKYAAGGSSHILPAKLPPEVFSQALRLAELAHEKIGCCGVSRSDFRFDDSKPGTKGLYFLEINTQPGMTPTSLVPEQANHLGISFQALVSWLIEDAIARAAPEGQRNRLPTPLALKNSA